MKLQLGLLQRNGRPATPDDLERMLGELGSRPAEVAGDVVDGALMISYRGDRIADEDDAETQPLQIGPYVLTWDGRLDNREEFAARLGLSGLDAIPDPVIVLKAYEAFGRSAFSDLIGEFALALWCRRTKSLQFARSACGARSLYYVLTKDSLIWSSDFAHLVRVSGVPLTVNDDYAIQYLVSQPAARVTPLTNVDAVPPNRLICFEDGRVKVMGELWNPTRIPPLQYRTDQEYEEHCREKIKEAVRVRMRAKHTVFSELSGGLDSSSIVLVADEVLRGRNQSPQRLKTVSCVYEESQTCDEQRFIQAVEERRGVETLKVHEGDQRITLGLDCPTFTGLPNALHCFPGRYETVTAIMRRHEARVLLTGRGGDHLFWSDPDGGPIVADKLYQWDVRAAHRECKTWSRLAASPYYELLVKRAIPLTLGGLWPRQSGFLKPAIPAWLHPQHKEQVISVVPDFDGYANWRSTPSRRVQVAVIEHMFRYLGSGFFREYDELYVTHPYTHRPLAEFCLGVPVSQFLRDGQTRSLIRRAFAGVLPQKISKRLSKGLLDETILRAVQRERTSVADLLNWQVCERGYVNYAGLAEVLGQARVGFCDLAGPLARLFSLERWLRSLSHVQASTGDARAQRPSQACAKSALTA